MTVETTNSISQAALSDLIQPSMLNTALASMEIVERLSKVNTEFHMDDLEELERLIRKARFLVNPTEENVPDELRS